jgi:hypothetical protein
MNGQLREHLMLYPPGNQTWLAGKSQYNMEVESWEMEQIHDNTSS